MKFLCLACDEPMEYAALDGPDEDGSCAVTFCCPRCGHRLALLTNPWETQIVRSLNVKIGGRTVSAQPYEQVRETLPGSGERILEKEPGATEGEVSPPPGGGGKCPFSGLPGRPEGSSAQAPSAAPAPAPPRWTEEAAEELEEIPEAYRPMAMKAAEGYVLERGQERVTAELLREVRAQLGL
ncbi:MAG: hypothetical protein ACE5JJ_02275 [Nitrospinota bacterium]